MVRIKQIVTGAAAAGLGLALLGTPSVAGAKTGAPPATGSITCAISPGTVHIKGGKLLDAEPYGPRRISFAGTLSGCTAVGGGAAPSGITGGKIKGSMPTDDSACSGQLNEEPVGAKFTIKWKGASKVADTVMAPTRVTINGLESPTTHVLGFSLVAPGTGPDSAGFSTGSFSTSPAQSLTIHSPTSTSVPCSPKSKAVKGSGGLKKVTIGIAVDNGVSLALRSSTVQFGSN
jgi:hypothetical protein